MLTSNATPLQTSNSVQDTWDQVADAWHESARYIRPWLRRPTDAMIAMAGVRPGQRVLDVAAGAGDQTLDVAAQVGPSGYVLATDISGEMLAEARRNALTAGYEHVDVRVCNGEHLEIGDRQFDAVVCRLGLMFFQNPLQGLREMARVLKPGGGVCTLVFAGPRNNPCITTILSTVFQHIGSPPGDPYQPGGLLSLGRPGLADELFRQAGFDQIATTISAPFMVPSVRDYVRFIRTSAGPIHQLMARLDQDGREAVWSDIESRLTRFTGAAGWEGPNELLLTAARRPL